MFNTNELLQRAVINNKVTDKYRFVDTDLLINQVQNTLTSMGLASSYTIKASKGSKTTKHIVDFRLDDVINFLGDKVYPRIIIINSYNGEAGLQVRVGFFRLVCSNGLIIGQDYFKERIVHVKGQATEDRLLALKSKIQSAIQFIQNELSNLATILNKELTLVQEMNIVTSLGLADKHTDYINKALYSPFRTSYFRTSDNTHTVWGLYNIINEQIRGKTDYTNDVKNLNLMSNIVKLVA